MFSINTNINALQAINSLNMTKSAMSKSMTQLSTGLRINTAGDDPSGLIAAKRNAAQITSMTQAESNTQDAINYSKTADGALDEVNTLLQDARTLAVASGNSATLTPDQLAANQQQLASIVSSITRISSTTQYGTKKLLDGSAGTQSAVTAGDKLSSLTIGGQFGGGALTTNGTVDVNVTAAAAQGEIDSQSFTSSSQAVGASRAGSFSINGTTFNATATTTASDLVDTINKASNSTGVVASYENNKVVLKSSAYGSKGVVNLVDAGGVMGTTSGTGLGQNALATVTIGAKTATFTGSVGGGDGLTLADADGNTLKLTAAGNAVADIATAGQVIAGNSQFQIGANQGQTSQLSIGNFAASELGKGSGGAASDLTALDLTTFAGATDALTVIDKAIKDVTTSRGRIGNFQKNVLESNARNLAVSKENLQATQSQIQDVDVASEMTNYTKLTILQSTGMAILAQAKSGPQSVLQLLQG